MPSNDQYQDDGSVALLDRSDNRVPLSRGNQPADLPELGGIGGPRPFAFSCLTRAKGHGGILPSAIGYDPETQTGTYDDLPPGVYMTKYPPKTYETTQPSGLLDANDDPGSSDD
ncbi:hypothetical protein I5Q34_16525 [Streptomyces sp. AV19]|uniref:hypothetical protein n=1 Tax=Streptomyces sp. AV19 TaxID=2793068 RepID=UPI0018FE82A3|nr:hypothetical protein [Streptomyces sp. AV19]MBH1935853.1 hypothetical protein [Streptomyces sp. AV19]MDG4534363.1 hypothetical protein [Streptomyces sp. AV19]